MVISLRASLVSLALVAVPFAASAQPMAVPVAVPSQGMVAPMQAPPPVVQETPSPSPGPGHTWVAGYWTWNGSQYSWNAGHWERTPQDARGWEAPRWERENGRYQFRPGRWAGGGGMQPNMQPHMQPNMQPAVPVMQAPPAVVAVPTAMPRPRPERAPRMIPRGQTWVPGYWSWNGSRYDWTAGHIEAPPRPRARWVAPRVERRGRQRVFIPGAWR